MKNSFSFAAAKVMLTCILLTIFCSSAFAKKIYPVKGSDNSVYINGPTYNYQAGDTFVLRSSSGPYSFMELISVNGTATNPVVVINEGGQVSITQFRIRHCRNLKVRGVGSASANYGFFMTSPFLYQTAFDIMGRSANVEVNNVDINVMGYGFYIKQEAACEDSLQAPNWVLDNISVHDCRIANINQEGFYAGSTAPNGERSINCNGATISPIPMRLGNIKIYNNIIDRTGRGGIQLSNAPFGNNEIYNNTISNCGTELNDWQGNGIVLGAYTSAFVHHNNINQTLSSGIFSLGAGLVRIENNVVNNSGSLNGKTVAWTSNIYMDTRQTSPAIPLQFIIKNNTLGAMQGDKHIRIYKGVYPYATSGNVLCNNTLIAGGPAIALVENGLLYTGCTTTNQTPVVNAGTAQTVTLPLNTASLTGTATDADGTISSYAWSQVSGPNNASFATPNAGSTSVSGLVAGTYSFKLTATDNNGASAFGSVSITVNAATATTPSGSTKIEAESYTQMAGIQTENTQDAGGGLNIGWQDNNDWMDYSVNVATAATYAVKFRVASYFSGAQFQIRNSAGTVLATVTVPNTGTFQTWQTITANVPLAAGQQTLRIITSAANGGWNFNWFEITGVITGSTPTTDPVPTPPPPTASTMKIEAEAYTQMSGVQTENTQDVGGGLNVGWQDNNDWMDYNVNLSTAANYTVNFRVASYFSGAKFQMRKSDGTVLATVTVPQTGSFQNWQTVSAQVSLPAGPQTVRIVTSAANGGWNFNWMEVAGSTTGTPTTDPIPPAPPTVPSAPSMKIEAEAYTQMSGVQTENTQDIGGGLNVGWQDNNDWMDYSVNLPAAGSQTLSFRVSSYFSGAQFQVRNSGGTILATVTVPNTGTFQTWTTVTATATLPAGQQTLRLFTNAANGGWNMNWWQIAPATTSVATAGRAEEIIPSTSFSVFPSLAKDRVLLKVANGLTGTMKIEILTSTGETVQQFNRNRSAAGNSQTYLSLKDLKPGQYFIRLSMNGFTETTQLTKE